MPEMKRSESAGRFVLLGMLQMGPGSGYDLRQRIDGSIGYFWREGWGQIYPALRQMQAEKLAKCRVEAGNGRPDRNVYSITRRGTDALRRWLAIEPRPEVPRNELLLKLFFGERLTPAQNIGLLRKHQQAAGQALATYEQMRASITSGHHDNPNLAYWLMTLRSGVLHEQAELAWCEETIRTLEGLQQQGRRSN